MRLVRAAAGAGSRWGVLRDEAVHLLAGDPYDGRTETGEVLDLAETRLLAPVSPSKIMCVGKNYVAHVEEMGFEASAVPSVFMKPPTTILDPEESVVLPPPALSSHVEHEAEVAVVIGRTARCVAEEDAMDHVLGFTCADDVSARDLQRSDPHPTRGKGFDTFCPVGPWVETDVDLRAGVGIECRVNGELRQRGSTDQMMFSIPFLISHLSEFTTLLPGDLVLTGSPGGTGPLLAGDTVEVEVSGVGVLRHGVR